MLAAALTEAYPLAAAVAAAAPDIDIMLLSLTFRS
jgi:hypothetical protein